MNQKQAREIISSLSSLYPLKDYEEEAINTILNQKKYEWSPDEETTICPNCNEWVNSLRDNFCNMCGQPLKVDS